MLTTTVQSRRRDTEAAHRRRFLKILRLKQTGLAPEQIATEVGCSRELVEHELEVARERYFGIDAESN
jgi:hypothetical protein